MTTKQQYETSLRQIEYFWSLDLPTKGQLRELEYNVDIVKKFGRIKLCKEKGIKLHAETTRKNKAFR
jgi:hypothetical protein